MAQSGQLKRLAELPLLKDMPDHSKERIANVFLSVSETVTLADREVLLREGDLGGDFGFVLVQGKAEIHKEGAATIDLHAPSLLGEMQQFNPQAFRTATVRAKGQTIALKFLWQELYSQAEEDLHPVEQTMLMDSIEHMVWERFDRETLMDLGLFQGLPDQLKLRACLTLQWTTQNVALTEGETLFRKDEMCGAHGYLLTQGSVELARPHQSVQRVSSPDLLGVMPRFDPNRQWTATATAVGNVALLKFSWLTYNAMLEQRLSQEEHKQLTEAFEASAEQHFVH